MRHRRWKRWTAWRRAKSDAFALPVVTSTFRWKIPTMAPELGTEWSEVYSVGDAMAWTARSPGRGSGASAGADGQRPCGLPDRFSPTLHAIAKCSYPRTHGSGT